LQKTSRTKTPRPTGFLPPIWRHIFTES
jgi:hypothetical protein